MTYLLDTNACIKILNGDSRPLEARLRQRLPSELALCSVVKAELVCGARRSARAGENLATLRAFFSPLRSYPFDDTCVERYAIIRTDLERVGRPIGPYDMMIAATAVANDAVLVTHNTAEFSRVVDLRWEDWEVA